jgi:hypothetical protein
VDTAGGTHGEEEAHTEEEAVSGQRGGVTLARWLLYGSPILSAAITAAGFMAPDPIGATLLSEHELPFMGANVLLAIAGSGMGGWWGSSQAWRPLGLLGGAALGFVGYLAALSVFTLLLVLE